MKKKNERIMNILKHLENLWKSGSQKTEFQGEFGARHEKNRKKIKKLKKSIKLPGPDRYPDRISGDF